jgi:rare lipoprotein A
VEVLARADHVQPGSLRLLLFGCVTFACAREAPSVFVNQPVSPAPAPPVASSTAPAPPAPNPPKSPAASGSDALAERYGAAPPLAVFKGEASYYGDQFSGRKTASGELYNPRALTAAHRELPFGTVVRVVRSEPPGVVYVRITDRGPFRRGRVLDLSRAAAEQLQMIRAGVIPVRAEVVEFGPKPKPKQKRTKRQVKPSRRSRPR